MSLAVTAVMVVHRVVGAVICCGLAVKGGCWRFAVSPTVFVVVTLAFRDGCVVAR